MSIYAQFARTWDDGKKGFGRHSYNDAISAGYTPLQIEQAVAGQRVGTRGQDLINAARAARERAQASGYESGTQAGYTSGVSDTEGTYRGQIDDYRGQIDDYRRTIGDYDQRIAGFNQQIGNYQDRVNSLSKQYNEALEAGDALTQERDDYMDKFRDATEKYEMEKAEADRYREQAVGQQLRAVRAGATAGGANQTEQMRGTLASGATGFSAERDEISDLAQALKGQGGLTDSVLNREGPVVQQVTRANVPAGGQRQATASAGTGSYYASRFR